MTTDLGACVDPDPGEGRNGERLLLASDLPMPETQPFAGGHAVVYTHRSPARSSNNQDSAALIACDGWSAPCHGMLVVADGAGGHADGDLASALAITHLARALRDARAAGDPPQDALIAGIDAANKDIAGNTDNGMTTLVLAELVDDTVRIAHAGDSVALLIGRRGVIKHGTVPHSPVGYAIQAGLLDEDDAMSHHQRHIISNALGMAPLHVEVGPVLDVAPDDTLLLASDGLFDNLSTKEIVEILCEAPLLRAVQELVKLSQERMLGAGADGRPFKPDDLTILAWRREA